MARNEERQAFRTEYSEEQQKHGNYHEDDVVSPGFCCCFGFGRGNHESRSLLRDDGAGAGDYLQRESWAAEQGRKLKELSEVVAGPKWKNFIRKIGRYLKPRKCERSDYMYTPTSYAMNFDDARLDEDEDDSFVSFSTRFSSAPLSADKQRPAPAPSSL